SHGLDEPQALRALHQDTVVPLDGAEPLLAVGIMLGRGRLPPWHLGDDIELQRLTISLETDSSEGIITNHEEGIDVVPLNARLIPGRAISRIIIHHGTSSRPVKHLRDLDDTEGID